VISFRYHIVSLVAVFLALAVGIVIGTTALNGPVTHDLRRQVAGLQSDRTKLANQVRTLRGQVDTAGQFATTFGAKLVQGSLKNQRVLVIALPGTSTGMQNGVAAELSAAGAQLTGQLQLAPGYTDPAQGSSIVSLATGQGHPPNLTLPQTSDPGRLGAALLAFVLVGKGQPSDLKSVLGGFFGLHMITANSTGVEPAKTVVVIGNGWQAKDEYAGQSGLDLVTALTTAGGTVVVAGDSGSARDNGIVALVRNSAAKAETSTIDNADTAVGRVATTLAVAGSYSGEVGQYGVGRGAQALFPSGVK
jgi:hypothetical protein